MCTYNGGRNILMDIILQKFNADTHTKEAFLEFIFEYIAKEGVRRIYAHEDVTGIRDARNLINGAFEYLHETYAIPAKPTENSTDAR